MATRNFVSPVRLLGLLALLGVLALLAPPPLFSQVQDGATMTVLRGQVAVVRPDGSAIQPAPSGTIVATGDEIRTLTAAGALITFFAGTEIEMGADTILVVEQVSRQGDRVNISLKQVLGATINRVTSLTDPGSSYRIEAGGAVAVVRGTTFAVVGPIPTTSGDVVVLVCLDDCDARSTFAGCPLAPFMGYFVAVAGGRLESGCQAFAVTRGAGLFEVAFQAVTTAEQFFQGDTRGRPAGAVQGGQRNQVAADLDQEEEDDVTDQTDAAPSTTPTATATTQVVSVFAPTNTPTLTNTATSTPTGTLPPTNTPTSTSTPTPTQTNTPTPTSTATSSPTSTPVPGSITARKFEGDGEPNENEPPLPGWTMFIDTNGNGSHDSGELSEVTDDFGEATFSGIAPGTYSVCEELQDGWVNTDPGPASNTEPCKSVVVTSGTESTVTFRNLNIT